RPSSSAVRRVDDPHRNDGRASLLFLLVKKIYRAIVCGLLSCVTPLAEAQGAVGEVEPKVASAPAPARELVFTVAGLGRGQFARVESVGHTTDHGSYAE